MVFKKKVSTSPAGIYEVLLQHPDGEPDFKQHIKAPNADAAQLIAETTHSGATVKSITPWKES